MECYQLSIKRILWPYNETICNTEVLKSNFCDYSDA